MPILQAVWVAFQRLPTALYTYDGKEFRESNFQRAMQLKRAG
jgi:hypothetical protein